MTGPASVAAVGDVVVDLVERWWHPLLAALLLVEFGLLVVAAYGRPIWHDEVTTWLMAELPLARMREAYLGGMDLFLPLNTLLTHVVHQTIGLGQISSRLPSMLGYLTATYCLFQLVRRRANAALAMGAAMLLAGTLAWRYGSEARGYGLTLACAAVAWYAWSEQAAGRAVRRHTILMGLALALGLWSHHYAVLIFAPVAVGEAVAQWQGRAWRAGPWVAMAAATTALVPLIPLLQVAAAQRMTFWGRPQLSAFATVYPDLLAPAWSGPVGWVATGLLLAWLLFRLMRRRVRDLEAAIPRRFAPHEVAAALVVLAVPLAGVMLGYLARAFTPRYVTFSTVGIVAVATLAAWRTGSTRRRVDAAMLMIGAVALAVSAAATLTGTTRWRPADQHPRLVERLRAGQQTVVAGSIAYLQFWHYATPDERAHAVYLADPAAELRVRGSNTVDLGYLAVARYTAFDVERLESFVGTHPTFMLYVIGQPWQPSALADRGATLRAVASDEGGTLYEVTMAQGR